MIGIDRRGEACLRRGLKPSLVYRAVPLFVGVHGMHPSSLKCKGGSRTAPTRINPLPDLFFKIK